MRRREKRKEATVLQKCGAQAHQKAWHGIMHAHQTPHICAPHRLCTAAKQPAPTNFETHTSLAGLPNPNFQTRQHPSRSVKHQPSAPTTVVPQLLVSHVTHLCRSKCSCTVYCIIYNIQYTVYCICTEVSGRRPLAEWHKRVFCRPPPPLGVASTHSTHQPKQNAAQ